MTARRQPTREEREAAVTIYFGQARNLGAPIDGWLKDGVRTFSMRLPLEVIAQALADAYERGRAAGATARDHVVDHERGEGRP